MPANYVVVLSKFKTHTPIEWNRLLKNQQIFLSQEIRWK